MWGGGGGTRNGCWPEKKEAGNFRDAKLLRPFGYNNEKVNFQNFEEVTYYGTFGTQLYVVLSNI